MRRKTRAWTLSESTSLGGSERLERFMNRNLKVSTAFAVCLCVHALTAEAGLRWFNAQMSPGDQPDDDFWLPRWQDAFRGDA